MARYGQGTPIDVDVAIATCIEEAWVVLVLGTTTNPLSVWL